MTEYPSPSATVDVFGTPTTVKAADANRVTFVSQDNVWINRIPVSFVVTLSITYDGTWSAHRRADVRREDINMAAPATENQIIKLTQELSKISAELPASFLLDGQTAQLGRIVERSQARVDSIKENLAEHEGYLRADTMAYEASVLARP